MTGKSFFTSDGLEMVIAGTFYPIIFTRVKIFTLHVQEKLSLRFHSELASLGGSENPSIDFKCIDFDCIWEKTGIQPPALSFGDCRNKRSVFRILPFIETRLD